jgi:hypothetical protein
MGFDHVEIDGDGGPPQVIVVLWLDIAQRSYCREVRACGIFDLGRIRACATELVRSAPDLPH